LRVNGEGEELSVYATARVLDERKVEVSGRYFFGNYFEISKPIGARSVANWGSVMTIRGEVEFTSQEGCNGWEWGEARLNFPWADMCNIYDSSNCQCFVVLFPRK